MALPVGRYGVGLKPLRVIGVDYVIQPGGVVFLAVDDRLLRQARIHPTLPRGPPKRQTGDRKHAFRNIERRTEFFHPITHLANRRTAEPHGFRRRDEALHGKRRIDGCVQEGIHIVAGIIIPVTLGEAFRTAHIGAERDEDRAVLHMPGIGIEIRQFHAQILIGRHDDGILLKVRLGRRRLRAGQQGIHHAIRDRLLGVTPDAATLQKLSDRRRQFVRDITLKSISISSADQFR